MLEYIMILTVQGKHMLVCVHAENEADAYYKTGKWCIGKLIFPDNMQCVEVMGSIEEIL